MSSNRYFGVLLSLTFCSLLWGGTTLVGQEVIFQNNFDGRSAGRYTDAMLDEDWNEPNFNNGVTEGRVSVVSGAEAFGGAGSALAITYPADFHGTRETGAQWRLAFGQSYEEVTLSYRVRFGVGFDFVRGGKLPGLAGGTAPTGSRQATGRNGWAGRMMWRTNFNGVSGQPQQLTSGGITYTKYTDSGFSGDGVQEDRNRWFNPDGSQTEMVSDQWYQITQRIVMNTPGEFNGIQQIFLDGVLVIDERNLRYRLDDSFAIDQVYFSTFYGGNRDWKTSQDEVAFFDDFVITVPTDAPNEEPPADGPDGVTLNVPDGFLTLAGAINAASDGDTIEISGQIRENVLVNKGIVIQAQPGTVIRPLDSSQATVTVDADGVQLSGFEVDGGRRAVEIESGSSEVSITEVLVRNATSIGINVRSGSHNLMLNDVEIRDSGSDGLRVADSDDILIRNSFSGGNAGHGYRLIRTDRATLDSNRSFGNRFHGFHIRGDMMNLMNNNAIQNTFRGFLFDGGDRLFVFDNLAVRNASHGFSFERTTNSQLLDNRARFNGGAGFRLTNKADFNSLDDSNATGNISHGIQVLGSLENEVINSFVFNNGRSGIFLNSTVSGTRVSRNVVDSNQDSGIADFGTSNQVVDDNIVRDNGN